MPLILPKIVVDALMIVEGRPILRQLRLCHDYHRLSEETGHLRVAGLRHEHRRLGEDVVTEDHSRMVVEETARRGPAPPRTGAVDDVVVHQACCVQKLERSGERHRPLPLIIPELACQQSDGRSHPLPAGEKNGGQHLGEPGCICPCHRSQRLLNGCQVFSDGLVDGGDPRHSRSPTVFA